MSQRKRKIGLAPGTIVYTGQQQIEQVFISHSRYDATSFKHKFSSNHQSVLLEQSKEDEVDWYDVRGLHDMELMNTIATTYQIPVLAMEDIADVHQRPKLEDYKNGVFLVLKSFRFNEKEGSLETEHISFFFRKGLLFSFQEKADDLFELIRKRLEAKGGRIRERGSDYLAYALADFIIDNYFVVLDEFENKMELLEDDLILSAHQGIKTQIHHLKKELLSLRKKITPLREAINRLSKLEHPSIEEQNAPFLRNLYDHTIQVMDTVESYRDIINGLQDLYLSEISFKMNQVMQVLTIITTIFVPLSFLAGLYGMNFEYMPELKIRYGYFLLLGLMFLLALVLLFWFRKKKWI